MPQPKETNIDELKTLSEAPEVLHLDIGLKGNLVMYVQYKPTAKRKPRKKPPTQKT